MKDPLTFFGVTFNVPSAQGIFEQGAMATIGFFLGYFYIILFMIWVGFAIYGGYKYVLSKGEEKGIEEGQTLIKNVWMSITWGVIFFSVLSVIGITTGIGDVTQWYKQLAQCRTSAGGFYFRDLEAQRRAEIPIEEIYCCYIKDADLVSDPYSDLYLKSDSWHYIGVKKGDLPPKSFTECVKSK